MKLLEVANLDVDFKGANGAVTHAVKSASFTLDKGEILAIVGESGSGKSVTALSILQLLPYPSAHHPKGSIKFKGQEMLGSNDAVLRSIRGNKISMIFQEPMTSLNPLHNIEQQISEVLYLHKKMTPPAARRRVVELLKLVGLENLTARLNSFPHELSGGQRQRVMIAMALANDPDILIADEPTTALDVTIQAQILQLLKDIQKQTGMAVILITHDLNVVRKIANSVAVMYQGETVEYNSVKNIFENPQHDYTKKLLASEPKGSPEDYNRNEGALLQAHDLKVYFPIKRGLLQRTVDFVKAVDGVDIELKPFETLGIVGESGSGKTTLGLALMRLIKSQGDITFQGARVDLMQEREIRPLRKEIQIVFQDPYGSLSPRMSVAEIVDEGLKIHFPRLKQSEREKMVDDVLTEVGIDPAYKTRYPHEFSGGQRQRISIARALILKPKVIILDEPTSALDMTVQVQIVNLLRELQKKYGLAYIFISHDLRVVRAMSHNVIVMKGGKAVERGTANDIFENPKCEYTKALINAAFNNKCDIT